MTDGLEIRYSIQLSYGDNEGLVSAEVEPLTVSALLVCLSSRADDQQPTES